jgi:hypothetical protein
MVPEPKPIGTFGQSEASPNPALEDMSLEQLSDLVKWPSKMEKFIEQREPTPSPEPDSTVPEPVEASPEPESTPEVVQPEPVEAQPPQEAQPTQEDIDRELLAARIEAAEANARKLEAKLVGREAGENGYIQQLKERIKRLEAGAASEPESGYREPPATEPELPMSRSNLNAWAVQQASKEAVLGFMQSHPDIATVEQDVMKYLNESGFDVNKVNQLDDPILAGREMTRTLNEAYWHVDATRKQARVAELQTQKAEQVRGLTEAKIKAASSASGSTPPPPKVQKATADLSLKELEARMKAFGRR